MEVFSHYFFKLFLWAVSLCSLSRTSIVFSALILIGSIVFSLRSLTLTSASSRLLLNPFSIFFSSIIVFFSSVTSVSSVTQSCLTLCDLMDCSMPGFPVLYSWSLLRLISITSVMQSSHLILCHPLFLLPSIFPSIRVFSNESVLHIRWPKYWSFSFIISPSNEYSGLRPFRMDWLDLLAVQGTLKSLLQHHSSKASILQCSAFFIVQLSHPYMTTGKNHSFD